MPNKSGGILKTIGSVLVIVMLLGAFFGVYRYMEGHYALAAEHKLLKERLDFKIADDKRVSFQKEMHEIEERNLGKTIDKWDSRDRARYQSLQDMLDGVRKNIEKMQ